MTLHASECTPHLPWDVWRHQPNGVGFSVGRKQVALMKRILAK